MVDTIKEYLMVSGILLGDIDKENFTPYGKSTDDKLILIILL